MGWNTFRRMSGVPDDGTQRVGKPAKSSTTMDVSENLSSESQYEDSLVEDIPVLVQQHDGTPYFSTTMMDRTVNMENESHLQGFRISMEDEEPGSTDGKHCVGMLRVSTTMNLSVNLANASHFDVNNALQGFIIWMEDEPGTTKDWYFVLPNVHGQIPNSNKTSNGLANCLTNGVLVCWDGRVICHCTSMMNRNSNVYGTFYALKSRDIAFGQSCQLSQSSRLV